MERINKKKIKKTYPGHSANNCQYICPGRRPRHHYLSIPTLWRTSQNSESQYFQKAWNTVTGPQPSSRLLSSQDFSSHPGKIKERHARVHIHFFSCKSMRSYGTRRFRPVFRPLPFNRTMFTRNGGGGGESKQSCVIRNNPAFSWVVRVFCGLAAFLLNVGRFFIFICLVAHRKSDSMVPSSSSLFFLFLFF